MSPANMSVPSAAPPIMPVSQGISALDSPQLTPSPTITSQIPNDATATFNIDNNKEGVVAQKEVATSPVKVDITDAPTVPETNGVLVISDTGTVSTPDSSTSEPASASPQSNLITKPPVSNQIPDQTKSILKTSQTEPLPSPIDQKSSSVDGLTEEKQTQNSVGTNQPDPNKTYVNLLDVLVDKKVITQSEANELMTQSIKQSRSLDQILEETNTIPEEVLAQARATFYKVPYVKLSEVGVYPEALSLIPESAARLHGVLAFSVNKQDNTLSVAMRNPLDVTTVNFVEQKTGMRVISYFAAQSEIERFIAEHYAQNLSSEVSQAVEQTEEIQKKQLDYSDLSGKTIREAPVTKIVQTILMYSLKTRASDVHIEPQEDKTRVRYRIDGILQEKLILPKSVHNAVVSRIKILSGLKIDERRLPQDGRFDFTDHDTQVDLRVSTLPTIHGEKVVMRLLKKNSQVPTLEQLGLNGLALRNMSDAIKVPHGIILVTGPTGSGKTTTLYSVLHTINSPRVNIVTLEDPVEYMMTGVNQVQVNPQAGLTFASGLRSFLRQDPNIIMVGEIRDSETANLAVQASLTGHLVFATLHTSSAAGAIPRLMDMGAEPFLLASSMTLVVAQRIARVINPEYKETYQPDPTVIKDIQEVLGNRFDLWLEEHNLTKESLVLTRATEKRPETEPEYKGRIAIFEVMKVSDEIGRLILARKPAVDLEETAIKNGMLLMKQDGYLKVLDGITTIEEVLRVAQI